MTLSLEAIASIDDVRVEWEELAARSGNIFATPEFLDITDRREIARLYVDHDIEH